MTNNRSRRLVRKSTIPRRSGIALLEAVIALLLFGVTVTGLLEVVRNSLALSSRTFKAESELIEASELLEHFALWPDEDLVRRLGTRPQGKIQLTVARISPGLYQLSLTNGAGKQILSTVVYRPTDLSVVR